MDKNGLQKSIDQIGIEGTLRYLPKGMKLQQCSMHGYYLAHYTQASAICPLCSMPTQDGNGTTATEVEHYINIKDQVQAETGYRPL